MWDPGFEGNDEEWQEQYHAMSEFFGWQLGDSESGITLSQFAELVDNDEDTTESELRQARLLEQQHMGDDPSANNFCAQQMFLCLSIVGFAFQS